jgi:dihydroneopterin aldolase
MDKIIIQDLEVQTHIGVTREEQETSQRLLITAVLELDLHPAGRTDQESATTPYDMVADLITTVVAERPRKLVEAVADEVAEAILSRRLAERVTIHVKKFSVPHTDHVAIEITRTQ